MKSITSPLIINEIKALKVHDIVLFSGIVYTMRDAAHKRFLEDYDRGCPPFDIMGQTVFYAGPTLTAPGEIIGSCGPTTSARMDDYTPRLLSLGLKCMIGKGERSQAVLNAISENDALYLVGTGGAAALFSSRIKSCEEIAYPELTCESIKKLYIENLPLIVSAK